jgi:polyisoprenyl-phosphate glycosyltransferase
MVSWAGLLKNIDIVTSAYNEEECLPELFRRLRGVFALEAQYSFRVLIADNGSIDNTWNIISEEAAKDPRILGFRMSRNFSLDAAFTNGLDNATGEAAIIMTSDLQDPPEIIPELLRKYEKGFDQVVVKIVSRKSVPFIRRMLSKMFYRIANRMTSGLLPESVSDFRLVSRKTYIAIRSLRESHRFLRGLSAWVGFTTGVIEIARPPRFAGQSNWLGLSLIKVTSQASKSLLAYSAKPLAWVSAIGLLLSAGTTVVIFVLSVFWLIRGVPFPGYGSLIGVMFVGFSIIMLCIGVLAQYMGLIYEEVKQRPLYVVSEKTF